MNLLTRLEAHLHGPNLLRALSAAEQLIQSQRALIAEQRALLALLREQVGAPPAPGPSARVARCRELHAILDGPRGRFLSQGEWDALVTELHTLRDRGDSQPPVPPVPR